MTHILDYAIFGNYSNLTSIDLSKIDTSNVTSMVGMFYGCSSLSNLDVTNFNTSNVTMMGSMFKNCSSLTVLDLSSFNTQNVGVSFAYMFSGCSSLKTIYASNLFVNASTNNHVSICTFDNCTNLVGAISFDSSKINSVYLTFLAI